MTRISKCITFTIQVKFTIASSWRLNFADLLKSIHTSCDNIVLFYTQQNSPYLKKKYKYLRRFLSFDSWLFFSLKETFIFKRYSCYLGNVVWLISKILTPYSMEYTFGQMALTVPAMSPHRFLQLPSPLAVRMKWETEKSFMLFNHFSTITPPALSLYYQHSSQHKHKI